MHMCTFVKSNIANYWVKEFLLKHAELMETLYEYNKIKLIQSTCMYIHGLNVAVQLHKKDEHSSLRIHVSISYTQ